MSNEVSNDNLILISGITGTGKSASLMSLRNDSGIVYANCEASKKLPFKHKFKEVVVTDPMTIFDIFEEAEELRIQLEEDDLEDYESALEDI